jgi:hypothetical protein
VSDSYRTLFLPKKPKTNLKTRILSFILDNNQAKMTDICGNVRKFAPKFEIYYSMRRFFLTLCVLFVAVSVLTSCLNSDDDSSTSYNDTAITTFTLGTLNRYLHTTSKSGNDSVYKVSFAASTYKMNIDQLGDSIYNTPSLPYGTDAAHVVCTITTKNNGIVFLKSLTSDTLTYFSSGNDSVDFRQPRVFRVFSSDGNSYHDYNVKLNISNQNAGVLQWTEADQSQFPVARDNAERQSAEALGYTYLGRTYLEAYALSPDGQIMELEDETGWKKDSLESDASLLPMADGVAYTAWILDIITDYALIVGRSNASDKAMTLWRKLADYDLEGRWVYMPLEEENPYYLPKMDFVVLAYFNETILAFGSDKKVYASRDQGITWKTTSRYAFPAGFDGNSFKVAVDLNMTDYEEELWLMDTTSGKTWKGRLAD